MKIPRKGQSVQDLIGIQSFTDYGLATNRGELLFYLIAPTNISVLSKEIIESKIHHLMMVLFSRPDLEIVCTDASECFDENKLYMQSRRTEEKNLRVRDIIAQDIEFLDRAQTEMATARQFVIMGRCRNLKPENVFSLSNDIQKEIAREGFDVRRMKKSEIKRFLALYFGASPNGELLPNHDGGQYADLLPITGENSTPPVRSVPSIKQSGRKSETHKPFPEKDDTEDVVPPHHDNAQTKQIRVGFGGYVITEDNDG